MEQFYTLKEIEDNLRISNRTLRRYIKTGKLESVKVGGKHLVSEENYHKLISGK